MSDIVTHRIRIGSFQQKVKNCCLATKSTQSTSTLPKPKLFLSLLLVCSWMVVISMEADSNPPVPSSLVAFCPIPCMHTLIHALDKALKATILDKISEPVYSHSLSRKQQNKVAHTLNGNKQVGIKLAHCTLYCSPN